MRLFKHILRLRYGLLSGLAADYWRLFVVLLVVLCIGVEPITNGINCQIASSGLLLYQPVGQYAAAPAPGLGVNLAQSALAAANPAAPASPCVSIVGGTPIGMAAPLSFLDKLIVSAGLALAGATLLRRLRLDALLRPPQIRYPPPTPPPIATAS